MAGINPAGEQYQYNYGPPRVNSGQYTPPGSRYTYGGQGSGTTYNPQTNSWHDAYGNQTSFNPYGGLKTITPQMLQGQQDTLYNQSLAGQRQGQLYGMQNQLLQNAVSGLSASGGYGGYGGYQPQQLPSQVSYQGSGIPPSAAAYDNAAFGAAKARAGQLGESALESLRGQLADRGILGSGVEARGLVNTLAAATNPLSDINVAQLGQNINIGQHAQDLAAQQAAEQFQGGITQRGQNIQAQEAQQQLQLEQQRLKQQQQLQLLQTALGGLRGSIGY